ncbi:MAG: hypothetical protein MUE33_07330 [Cytophagaceae bacterium]|jgi:hypothetical protein|nr:hypothetical protein [Cytophagaceae bacterium]
MIKITKKKAVYKIGKPLRRYLTEFGREHKLSISYSDLNRYEHSIPLKDKTNKDTFWETVFYASQDMIEIYEGLKYTYVLLKIGGDLSVSQHLFIDRIDICIYGNTKPFRVRVVNRLNDNFDYFYVKVADASRIYGLELEHILSPNNINYISDQDTLVEEHIVGVPGDMFIKEQLSNPGINKIRLAKEFVKFNERCFIRLLGDMHSSNYVIEMTPDFEEVHYRIRAIDFDQQCYDGRKLVYLPQYFPQNNPIINVAMEALNSESVRQYQMEERAMMAGRLRANKYRIKGLWDAVMKDSIAPPENIEKLKKQLADHYGDKKFLKCKGMGSIIRTSLYRLLKDTKDML